MLSPEDYSLNQSNNPWRRTSNNTEFWELRFRAYFKESLQLQRAEKFQTSKHFKISCQKKFSFPKNFLRPFFSHLKNTRYPFYFSISSTKNYDDLFFLFSHFLHFLCVSPLPNAAGTTAQPTFCIIHSQILKISPFPPFFSTLFHYSSSKFTTTTAQFPFYNCKLHFTTAQIVISCTLKYALLRLVPILA